MCQLSQPQSSKPPLKPILAEDFMDRIQVDLIDMQETPDGEYKFIGHFMDHFSKFHVLFPLKSKTAVEVAKMLEERVLAYLGTPSIFHSDNGREFVDVLIRQLFGTWGGDVTFVNGRPRHSQSQGLVERGNRVVEDQLRKFKAEHGSTNFSWVSWLPRVMVSLNVARSEPVKDSPYRLVFGRHPPKNILPGLQQVITEEELQEHHNSSIRDQIHSDLSREPLCESLLKNDLADTIRSDHTPVASQPMEPANCYPIPPPRQLPIPTPCRHLGAAPQQLSPTMPAPQQLSLTMPAPQKPSPTMPAPQQLSRPVPAPSRRQRLCLPPSSHRRTCQSPSSHRQTCQSPSSHRQTCQSPSSHRQTCQSPSSHRRTCQSPSSHRRTCQSPSSHRQTCQSPSSHRQTCQSPSSHRQTCQSPSSHRRTCQSPSSHRRTCPSTSSHHRTCHSPSSHLRTCQSPSSHRRTCQSPSSHH